MSIVKRTRRDLQDLDDHEHEFELKSYSKWFACDGCKKQGFGCRYKCVHCSYELHEECKIRKLITYHDFFQGSVFEFFSRPQLTSDLGRCCDACGEDINGFVYHCRAEGWDLHPCCTKLEKELRIDGTNFVLHDKVISKCMWCKKKKLWGRKASVPGWSYVSECRKYHFHVYCVAEMAHELWKKGVVDDSGDSRALENIDL